MSGSKSRKHNKWKQKKTTLLPPFWTTFARSWDFSRGRLESTDVTKSWASSHATSSRTMQKSHCNSCNTMRILDLVTEFRPNNGDLEESLLKIVDSSNKYYIKDVLRKRQPMKVQMKTILVGLDIVNWVEWLWNPSDSFVICFCGPESAQRSKEFLSFWLYWPIKTLH